jgi:hypothetical protein
METSQYSEQFIKHALHTSTVLAKLVKAEHKMPAHARGATVFGLATFLSIHMANNMPRKPDMQIDHEGLTALVQDFEKLLHAMVGAAIKTIEHQETEARYG